MNFKTDLSKDDINQYPLVRYEGPVELVRTSVELEEAVRRIRREELVGFDTETRPTFKKGHSNSTAVVQLACSDVVYLFQLKMQPFGAELASILSDHKIIKTGVAIKDDMRFLRVLHEFKPAALLDLGELAAQKGIKMHGLRGLAAGFLGGRISKGARCSNWNNTELSAQQISYAATDAWVSRLIYLRMREVGFLT